MAEQRNWELRKFSEQSQRDCSTDSSSTPRSATDEKISRRAVYIWCGVLATGCAYLVVQHDKSYMSWAIVFGLSIGAALLYERHRRNAAEATIREEMRRGKVELEERYERDMTERDVKRRDSIDRESKRKYSRYKRILEIAHRKQILLYEYFLYTYPPDWDFRVKLVKERDKYRCRKCSNESGIFHVHHQIRVGAGGTHHLFNLVTLCPKCHLDEHPSKRL